MVLTTIYMVHKELHGAMVEIDIEEVRTGPRRRTKTGLGIRTTAGERALSFRGCVRHVLGSDAVAIGY